jgi:hypothetical protein
MTILLYVLDFIIQFVFGIARIIFGIIKMFDVFGITEQLKEPEKRNIIQVATDDLHPERID